MDRLKGFRPGRLVGIRSGGEPIYLILDDAEELRKVIRSGVKMFWVVDNSRSLVGRHSLTMVEVY
jgi:hypothetical protein